LYILGLNFSIDAAAVLTCNGKVIAAACQERFDRVKHSAAFPSLAILSCLNQAGITMSDLDSVAVSWNPGVHLAQPNRLRDTVYRDHRELVELIGAHVLSLGETSPGDNTVLSFGSGTQIAFLDHHKCHAAAAYWASGFDGAAILTADGYGEKSSTTLAQGGTSGVETISTIDFPHSLGSVYAAVTQHLGYRPNNGEGKVMALAGLGDPSRHRDLFDTILRTMAEGFEVELPYFAYYLRGKHRFSDRFVNAFGQPRKPESEIAKEHLDLAAALQEAVERVLLHLANLAHEKTGQRRLCIAGGVALNAVAMGRIERDGPFEEVFVLPPAHDGGGPLGAAWLRSAEQGALPSLDAPYSDRLGPEEDAGAIQAKLTQYGLRFQTPESAAATAADLIAKGKIVGWFNGRMEFGPRALGARSILADVRDPKAKEIVNAKVKFREAFRPFAPVALEDKSGDWFEDVRPTPFMNKVYRALPDQAAKIPAVVHDDGTVRVQTVTASQDSTLHELISHFDAATGVPMVMNTSLNKRGQPICATVEDALFTFYTSGMDALFIGPYLIEK
jgi:carbamoyltransferase